MIPRIILVGVVVLLLLPTFVKIRKQLKEEHNED